MVRCRVWMMMLAALVLAVPAVQAQTSSGAAEPAPRMIFGVMEMPEFGCPAATWYFKAFQEAAATWQRVCGVRACDDAQGRCDVGTIKCEAAQTPKACCCAKNCSCCETCKQKKEVFRVE